MEARKDTLTGPERTEAVSGSLTNNRIPLLPFEVMLIERKLQSLGIKQEELSRLIGEAMSESSETWHDNAPAEAVKSQSVVVAAEANKLIEVLHNSEVFPYADADYPLVTLGSKVSLKFAGSEELDTYVVTGNFRELLDDDASTAVTVYSPLGSALLGRTAGETIEYPVGERKIAVELVEVTQLQA